MFNTSQEEKETTFVDTIITILSTINISIEEFIKDALCAYKYVHKLYNGEFFNKMVLDKPRLKMCLEKIISSKYGDKPQQPQKPKKPKKPKTLQQTRIYNDDKKLYTTALKSYPQELLEYNNKVTDLTEAYTLLTLNNAASYRNRYEDYEKTLLKLTPCKQLINLVEKLIEILDTFEDCLNQLELVLKYLDSKNNDIWENGIINEWNNASTHPNFSQFIVDTVLDSRNEKGIFKFLNNIINPKKHMYKYTLPQKIITEYNQDTDKLKSVKVPTRSLDMKNKYTPYFKDCLERNIQKNLFDAIDTRIQNYQFTQDTENLLLTATEDANVIPSEIEEPHGWESSEDNWDNYVTDTNVNTDNTVSTGNKKKRGSKKKTELSSGNKKKRGSKKNELSSSKKKKGHKRRRSQKA
jgi:hypothetical protein